MLQKMIEGYLTKEFVLWDRKEEQRNERANETRKEWGTESRARRYSIYINGFNRGGSNVSEGKREAKGVFRRTYVVRGDCML